MSISITLFSRGAAASRLLGRGVLGWTVAAAVGAGSGYYAGSTGHAAAARPAAVAATAALPAECAVTSVVGHGESLEDAVQGLEFEDSEIVLIGSSRLAQPKRLFLGHTASKIMRALPVPMIVWPRG